MLVSLDIRNMLVIDALELEFRPGLNVLTGETGAGKSILLDCLGFVLGWNTRAGKLRGVEGEGEVTAVFELPEGNRTRSGLGAAGLPDSEELLLRRRLRSDGRTAAWANERRCSLETLRRLSDGLVEILGHQHERGLMDERNHLDLLDRFAGTDRTDVGRLWRNRQALAVRLARARDDEDQARKDLDYLRHAVAELQDCAPEAGEVARLEDQRRLMHAAERVRDDLSRALNVLGSEGAESMLTEAIGWLQRSREAVGGRMEAAIDALDRALEDVELASRTLADCFEHLDADPSERDRVDDRLFALRGLSLKHGVSPDALPSFLGDLKDRLAAASGSVEAVRGLETDLEAAEASYAGAARALSLDRRRAGQRLDRMMAGELPPLRLGQAVFRTDVTESRDGPAGMDSVAFTASTSPGLPPGALSRIASGGELSRFLLALKACLAASADRQMLVFDEIDRGVGGATADAVGRRLASLAAAGQILAVTHSPQVAALSDHHFRVTRTPSKSRGAGPGHRVQVKELAPGERVAEIARMLSGEVVTDEAMAAAEALISGQGGEPVPAR